MAKINSNKPEQLMSTVQVAELLQIPVGTLHNWRYRGHGPAGFRVGRHIRFLRSDILQWIETQRASDPSVGRFTQS